MGKVVTFCAYPSLLAKLMEKSLREFKLSEMFEMFGDEGPPLDMALVLLMLVWQLQPFINLFWFVLRDK